ncbi:hypothetical protein VSH64_34015 [Amycolatopsis rhabdoformis]|uniref:NADH:flavin oxidoreductase/NADH oxidase N-terminal domain-containing protein n=1 Tax=Amycolatopsis rhabdoformis TaxID=1448059 RepID=A0ABZ1I226_9PSEU|nr:hypothetical protein [Amycolatopsis rhabdoformis]WSE27836.1 hypothetical protein VSH64_34015 [Amycolatopsis rhabdoformis]
MSRLFEPLSLRGLTLPNRAWVSPMCQYSAADGVPNDWHLVHLGQFAVGGAGLVLTEASAVVPEGRISPQDAGIWNDEQAEAWRRITDFAHAQGAVIGMQLGHAGRKASTRRPWEGIGTVPASEGGWPSVGADDQPFGDYAPARGPRPPSRPALAAARGPSAGRRGAVGGPVLAGEAASLRLGPAPSSGFGAGPQQ